MLMQETGAVDSSFFATWVTAFASLVAAGGILFVWKHTRLLRKQVVADHERSRRQLTIELLQHWNRSLTPVTAAAEKLVSQFSEDQCRRLIAFQPITVNATHRPLVETCLEGLFETESDDSQDIELSEKQVTRLRALVISYLNETEALLLGWHLSIVDREMIEKQFQFLYDEPLAKRRFSMSAWRAVVVPIFRRSRRLSSGFV